MKNSNSKVKNILGIVITIIAIGFSLFIVFNGSKEAEITIDETTNTLEVSDGLYSQTIIIDNEVTVTMISPVEITRKTNGSSVKNVKKGFFIIEGDLAVYLNLGDSTHDWIEIIDGEDYYYINLKSTLETTQIYNQLQNLFN